MKFWKPFLWKKNAFLFNKGTHGPHYANPKGRRGINNYFKMRFGA